MTLKEKTTALLDYFKSEKNMVGCLECGHDITFDNKREFRIHLHDVLEKGNFNFSQNEYNLDFRLNYIITDWNKCGITRSLNDIFDFVIDEDSEGEETVICTDEKDESAMSLFDFLWDVFRNDIQK